VIGSDESVRTEMFLYKAQCNRSSDQISRTVGVEFLHQLMPVVLNRSPASAEGSGDLLVGLPCKDRLQNECLTSGQRCADGEMAGKGLFQEVIQV